MSVGIEGQGEGDGSANVGGQDSSTLSSSSTLPVGSVNFWDGILVYCVYFRESRFTNAYGRKLQYFH